MGTEITIMLKLTTKMTFVNENYTFRFTTIYNQGNKHDVTHRRCRDCEWNIANCRSLVSADDKLIGTHLETSVRYKTR